MLDFILDYIIAVRTALGQTTMQTANSRTIRCHLRKGRRFRVGLWFERTLAMRQPGKGVGGFWTYAPEKMPVWDPDPSLLSGAVGITLALLAAISPIEPAWDLLLLLSR